MGNTTRSFQEFKDFIYLSENKEASMENITIIAFLKVFGDKNKKEYLGSLKIGFYFDYEKNNLLECLEYILSLNYLKWDSFEQYIYIKNK